jgi:transcriptional antiterminator RfaH
MPLLRAEQNVFPESLLGDVEHVQDEERQWHVLHTRPRQEKSLARQLLSDGIPFYLPIVQRRLRFHGRTMTSRVPLFPGYVFLFAEPEQRVAALATRRVVQSLVVRDQERLWHDLRQIDLLIASGAPITPEDRLAPGAKVRIRSGPLAGLEGKILRTASGRRFVVQVNFIQRGASVLLNDFDVVEIA